MTESTPLDKAQAAVTEAETNTTAVQLALAAVELAKLAQQQPAPACQHQHKTGRSASEWLAIGCAVCVGGVGLAFASIAIAIGATCATVCLLILRRVWQDMQKGR
ncbi:hypothetical protein ACIQCF_25865 [Streptomyces sp. NPDC088353]|uniref:hypothetical protein n=1 Tax=Streptomyces sp. NPDC088353 TaxID=3365855 RepID=UPI00381860FD